MSKPKKKCETCGCKLDVKNDGRSKDCGGDCLACMAEAGDPDCQREIRKLRRTERLLSQVHRE